MKIIPRKNSFLSLFNDDFFDDFYVSPFSRSNKVALLKTDIIEKEKAYTFLMDMPGVEKDDIKISVEDGYLTVSVNKDYSKEEVNENEVYLRRERIVENISRRFYVGDIDKKNIKAKCKNGVLSIDLPKKNKETEKETFIKVE